MKKDQLNAFIATIAVIVLAGGVYPTSTYARGMGDFANHESLIAKIAQRFGLKATDVQSVFDAQRSEHQAQMKERMLNRLTQLVTDKKITEAQKNLIIAKHDAMQKEMQTMRDQMKDKTPEERHVFMETKRVELEKWAKDNGIDLQYLKPFGPGKGMHKGFKGMHGDR